MYRAMRAATIAVAMSELHWKEIGAFRIVHLSIQRNHVHLLVEADNKYALANGLQRFQISAAKNVNREVSIERCLPVRRRGSVFPDRYHMEIITTPRQARHALAYVLNNWRKHREDKASALTRLVGEYAIGETRLKVSVEDGRLRAHSPPAPAFGLKHVGGGRFVRDDNDDVQYEFAAGTPAPSLVRRQGATATTALRVP
jgi:hypothetical protein